MKKIILKYKLFLIFLFISVLASLQSTSLNSVLHIPLPLCRVFTALTYLPFILFILWKLICDIKERKFGLSNILFYAFALYYAVITVFRFFNHMEIKENLYYSVILFGSLSMCMQIVAGRLPVSSRDMVSNFTAIAIYMVLFRLINRLILQDYIYPPPININLTSGVSALLIPVLLDACCKKEISKKELWICSLTVVASLVVIGTTGSRAIFMLTLPVLAVMTVSKIKTGMVVKRILPIILASVVIVGAMAVLDIGRVRYSLYRETTIHFFVDKAPSGGSTDTPDTPDDTDESHINSTQSMAIEQTNNSDNMRAVLVNWGINQIKQNFLFGTGDVEYVYHITETYAVMQSSHNFLIESLICYGAVGTVLLLALFASLIFETKFFRRKGVFHDLFCLIVTMAFFFAFGMVQPIIYSYIMAPVFAWILAYYTQRINNLEMKQYDTAK